MFQLLENVVQIEDLKLPEFLHKVQNLATLDLKKAVKGMTFFFGLDDEGRLFSSKYGAEDKFYSTTRYQKEPDNNTFIGAHRFVFKFKGKLEKALSPGDIIECKVQFFTNSFDDTNKLVLIKGEHLSAVEEILDHKTLIRSQQTFSLDGRNTNTVQRPSYWVLGRQKKAEDLNTSGIKAEVEKLKSYLEKASDVDDKMTNYELAQVNLGSIPMEKRSVYKVAREKVNDYILTNFKLPIKNLLIDQNKEMEIQDGEKTIEIKDNSILKNNFFLQAKHELSGIIRTSDPDAKLELRGGLYGEVLQRIATLFGIPEMANIQSAKKVLNDLKGETPDDTAANFAKSLGSKNFFSIRMKLIAVFKNLQKDIDEKLDQFKHDVGDYELKLSDDTVLKYGKEDVQNNLDAFGAISDEVAHILHELKTSQSLTDLVLIVFRRALELIHNEVVQESLATINLNKLTAEQICHAYMANYLCALLLLRAKDKPAAAMLRSRPFYKKMNLHGSRLHFWGFLTFGSNYGIEVKKLLNSQTYKDIEKIAGRLIDNRIKFALGTLARANNFIQDWRIHESTTKLFLVRLEVYESGLKDCIDVITKWEDATLSDKVNTVNKLYFFLQRHDAPSPLFPRMRELANRLMVNSQSETSRKENVMSESLLKQIVEDDAGDIGQGADAGVAAGSTTSAAIANLPIRLFKGKVVIKRPRTYEKKKKFARPQKLAQVVDPSNTFESIKAIESTRSINLVWDDDDCFKPGYQGYDYVRKAYDLHLTVWEAKTNWPEVTITGNKANIKRFLTEQYGMSTDKIATLLGE